MPFCVALAAGLLFGAGCTRVSEQASRNSAHPGTIPGELRVGFYESLDNLNPLLSLQSYVGEVELLIFSGLVTYDDHYRLVPDVATDVPTLRNGGISADGLTITYHLRHGVLFSDGAPLTSADVAYTWQQLENPDNNAPNREPAERVRTIETPDPYTVVVRLKAPYSPFVSSFLRNGYTPAGGILPKHLLGGYSDLNHAQYNLKPVGSGPFVVESWEPGLKLTLAANARYWRGAPKLKRIVISIIPDENSLLFALRAHDIDFDYNVPESQYDQLKGLDGIRVSVEPSFSLEHIKFNCGRAPLSDVRVRQAIAYAIDWSGMARRIYRGLGVQGMADVRPDSWAYNPAVVPYPYDPARARGLLRQAGWAPGADGVLSKDGRALALKMITVVGAPVRLKAEELVQQDLKAIGVEVDVHNYPANLVFATFANNGVLTRGNYDLALVTMDLDQDPDNSINLSPDQLPPRGQNRSFFVDEQVGHWEAAAERTYDPALRRHYYMLVQQRVHDALPFHGIVWRPSINAYSENMSGYRPGAANDFWNSYDWSI
ncbi:MAG: peptide ABC transporter substrate-binding protein [Candidatus Eremiobacteraeota bacterium]|nr:peptide ABC transporter substrate-binding protein [Candidatus Eremiobacteraeota bacterium]